MALSDAGVGELRIAEDDCIDESNLHRQILYRPEDVGRDKLSVGIEALRRLYPRSLSEHRPIASRFLPDNALELLRGVDLVVEGSDNFATKFLVADACRLARLPVVQGAAVRWQTTAYCIGPQGRPCYRCLFEDLPDASAAPNCAEAGVMGPVVGMGAALMVDFALSVLAGPAPFGNLARYDGWRDQLRITAIGARADCALCGAAPSIVELSESRYLEPVSCQGSNACAKDS